MDAKVIAAIIGLSGLFIGAVLNGVGFFLRERYKRLRIKNQTIFYLLKVLHTSLAIGNIDKMVQIYSNILKEHLSKKGYENFNEEFFNHSCAQVVNSIISPISQEVDEDFKRKFNESIFELSSVKPVIAYDLGRTSYLDALLQIATSILNNPDSFVAELNEEDKIGFEKGIKASQEHISQKLEKDLIKVLKRLSWSVGILNLISCRYAIFQVRRKFSDRKIKVYLEKYFETDVEPLID